MLIDGHCLSSEYDLLAKCSILKSNFPENLHLLSFKRDQYLPNMLIVRFQNFDEKIVNVQRLENYFSFKKEIVNVVKVGLSGIENSLSEDVEFPIQIDSQEILNLRIYLE